MIYMYLVFDGSPNDGGTVWDHREHRAVEAKDPTGAAQAVRKILADEAEQLTEDDGYSVGQRIHAVIYSLDGNAVAEVWHELTEGDLDRMAR